MTAAWNAISLHKGLKVTREIKFLAGNLFSLYAQHKTCRDFSYLERCILLHIFVRFILSEMCALLEVVIPYRRLGTTYRYLFNVHGSVQLGNVYVRLKVQLDLHGFICILYSYIFLLYVFRMLFAPILRSLRCVKWFWYVSPLEQVLAGTPSHF
jgi:hypothetical protein